MLATLGTRARALRRARASTRTSCVQRLAQARRDRGPHRRQRDDHPQRACASTATQTEPLIALLPRGAACCARSTGVGHRSTSGRARASRRRSRRDGLRRARSRSRRAARLEAMREAARHVAEILLELRERAEPGVTTAELDQHRAEGRSRSAASRRRSWATARTGCPVSGRALRLGQRRDRPRHPGSARARGRRHREPRLRRRRWTATTATRPSPCRSARSTRRRSGCSRSTRAALDAAIEADDARAPALGHRPRRAASRRSAQGFSVVRAVRRARHRPRAARAAADPELRRGRGAGRGCCRAWCSRSSRW